MLPPPTAISATTLSTATLISCSKQRAAGAFLGFKKYEEKEDFGKLGLQSKQKSLYKGSVAKGVFSRIP